MSGANKRHSLLGSLLLLLLLLGSFFTSSCRFLFLFGSFSFFLLLLLIHSSSNKQVHNRLGHDISIVVILKLTIDVINLILCHLVSKCRQDMSEVLLVQDMPSHNLTFDLLLDLLIICQECLDHHIVRIVDSSGHFSFKHLDHCVVGARSAHLAEHAVEFIIHDQAAHIVEGSPQVCLVDDSILVDVHESKTLLVSLQSRLIEMLGSLSFSVSLTHGW